MAEEASRRTGPVLAAFAGQSAGMGAGQSASMGAGTERGQERSQAHGEAVPAGGQAPGQASGQASGQAPGPAGHTHTPAHTQGQTPVQTPAQTPAQTAAKPAVKAPAKPPSKPPSKTPVVVDGESAKVVHIVRRLQEEAAQKRSGRKTPWLALSVLAAVVLPTLVAALYFLVFAADRYVSEARFAVRSNDVQMADSLGLLAGMPASTTVSDSYIVADFIRSREMVEALERRLPLRTIYAHPDADWLTRLDPQVTLEGLVDYWDDQVDVYYDSTKNTIALKVQAFTAVDAERIAAAVVEVVRGLVNELTAQARRDGVRFAATEVARAELRVRQARAEILAFRTEHNDLDPTQTALAGQTIALQLEGQRAQLKAQLASVDGYLSDSAPQVQMLKSRIAALETEIGAIQGQVSQGAPSRGPQARGAPTRNRNAAALPAAAPDLAALSAAGSAASPDGSPDSAPDSVPPAAEALASVVGRYSEVLLDQEFAEKAYVAAQASLERARVEADRTQAYLALYVNPRLAEAAAYPRRGLNVLIVLALAAVLWAVGALAALTIRDHMP